MPLYNFRHKQSGKVLEIDLPIQEREEFLDKHPEYQQIITAPTTIVHERGTNLRVTDGFRESLARVKETYKINNIKSY
jgi:hypothetical protein